MEKLQLVSAKSILQRLDEWNCGDICPSSSLGLASAAYWRLSVTISKQY
jgi:hypothetical protein